MLLIDIATKCIFAPIVGMMSDKVGRVPVLQIGIILTALSISSMGFAEDIYPQYCISRVLLISYSDSICYWGHHTSHYSFSWGLCT